MFPKYSFGQEQSPFSLQDREPAQQLFGTQDQQNPMNRFVSSPWMAMASSGLNNMSAMRRGGMPQTNPTKAYQQAVADQSVANQNQRKGELSIQAAEQANDPFFKYKTAINEGIIPPEMSYAEFQNIAARQLDSTSPIKNTERRSKLVSQIKAETDPEKRAELEGELKFFEAAVRAPQTWGGGGGSQYSTQPGSGVTDTLVDAPTATGREGALAEAKETGTQQAKTSAQQVNEGMAGARSARNMYVSAEEMLKTTDAYLTKFSGDEPIETGFIDGMLMNTFGIGTQEIGEMTADSVHAALINLGITNLAPVTEQEFASVMKMWGDISASPTANKGMLTAAKRRTERLMEQLREEAIYNSGLVEEFGSAGQYGAFRRSNTFVNDLLTDPEGTPDPAPTGKKEPVRPR